MSDAPKARAASTCSRSLPLKTIPRIKRAGRAQPTHRLLVVAAFAFGFLLVPGSAEGKIGAAAREHVQRRHRLHENTRIAIDHPGRHRAELHSLGQGSQVSERRVSLQHVVLGWANAVDLEEMIHDPEAVEPGIVRGASDLRQLGSHGSGSTGPCEVGYLQSDSHGTSS